MYADKGLNALKRIVLSNVNITARIKAVNTIGLIGNVMFCGDRHDPRGRALLFLIKLLDDRSKEVRACAASHIGSINCHASIPEAVKGVSKLKKLLLRDKSETVRKFVLKQINLYGQEVSNPELC